MTDSSSFGAGAEAIFEAADQQLAACDLTRARTILADVLFDQNGVRYDNFLFDANGVLRPEWRDAYLAAHVQGSDALPMQSDVLPTCQALLELDPKFVCAVLAQYDKEHPVDGRSEIMEGLIRADGQTWVQASAGYTPREIGE